MATYTGWIGSEQFTTKASNATEARRNIAHQYRNRQGYLKTKISEIMEMIELRRFV